MPEIEVPPKIDADAIRRAEKLIRPYVRRTPVCGGRVMEVSPSDFGIRAKTLVFKLELLQHAGSFKPRGAFTNTPDPRRAVGRRGRSLGRQSRRGGRLCRNAARPQGDDLRAGRRPKAKLDRIRTYGADLVVVGERYVDALAASVEFSARTGAMPVHAYDQAETLIGQGTLGLELEEQAPDLDSLLVAVGGGGLIGGVAAWYADARRSWASSRRPRRRSSWRSKRASRSMRRPAASRRISLRRSASAR